MEMVPWDVGRDVVVVGVNWEGCEVKGKGRRKTCFSAGYRRYTVYVHYYTDIRRRRNLSRM